MTVIMEAVIAPATTATIRESMMPGTLQETACMSLVQTKGDVIVGTAVAARWTGLRNAAHRHARRDSRRGSMREGAEGAGEGEGIAKMESFIPG